MSRMTGTWWRMEMPWIAEAAAGATEKSPSEEESEWWEEGAIGAAEVDVAKGYSVITVDDDTM